jgi:hypothetical protein
MERRFYVYVLFDADSVPRWVGKGQGSRIVSTVRPDSSNYMKNAFISRTTSILGEVPCVKVRTHLTEDEAFEIEQALIKTIGRRCKKTGPLTNLSAGGDGPTSADSKALHAAMTPMEKWLWKKAISDAHRSHPLEERRERGRKRMKALGKDARMAMGRKISATMLATTTPEQRSAAALKASIQVTKTRWINDGETDRRLDEGEPVPFGWSPGRLNVAENTMRTLQTVAIGRKWITDGTKTKRLKNGDPLPAGWTYGRPMIERSKSAQPTSSPESIATSD